MQRSLLGTRWSYFGRKIEALLPSFFGCSTRIALWLYVSLNHSILFYVSSFHSYSVSLPSKASHFTCWEIISTCFFLSNLGLWCIDSSWRTRLREDSSTKLGSRRICGHWQNKRSSWDTVSWCCLLCWYSQPGYQGCCSFGNILHTLHIALDTVAQ